jgi:hypothetical protein
MLPNFIIPGAVKAGTSSLYYYLRQHPEIFMPDNKEPHHFAPAKWCGLPVPDRKEYEQMFSGMRNEKAVGEASTGYLYYPESPELIHSAIPDCRIIVILRNPVDRAFSGYCHEVREGLETKSFEEALAEERQATRFIRGGEFSFNYMKQGYVLGILEKYLALFSASNVHLCCFEDLLANTDELMRSVFRFLDVDENFRGDWTYRYNPSGMPKYPWLHQLLDGENDARKPLVWMTSHLIPARIRNPLWHKIRDWNVLNGPAIRMREETRLMLEALYADETLGLEQLTGKDLSHWGSNHPHND